MLWLAQMLWEKQNQACLSASRKPRPESGAVLLSSAISIFLLITLAAGAIDYGLLFREKAALASGARIGARTAAALGTGSHPDWICLVAKQTAKNFLSDARLIPDRYNVVVTPKVISLSEDPDETDPLLLRNAIEVKISTVTPHWYFWSRNAASPDVESIFVMEHASNIAAAC